MTTEAPQKRHRIRRALLLVALFFAVIALAFGGSSWWLSHKEPDWYVPKQADPKELTEASERAEKQIQKTLSWAQDQQAANSRAGARVNAPPQPASSTEISFSQTELNGFFHKWDSTFGWSQAYSGYVADPMIALQDQKIIVAARVKQLDAVVSVELLPRLEKDQLQIGVSRVLAGRLPLPRAVWAKYINALSRTIEANLEDWKSAAAIAPRSGANSAAVSAAMGELLVAALHDQPAPPVLFLPITGSSRSLPVQVTDVQIDNHILQLTVRPLTGDEEKTLLARIRSESSIVSTN